MPVYGVDLSDFDHNRGPVDVAAMVRDGIVFLSHKATEGTSVTHVHYGEVLNAARAAGMPFMGAYLVVRTPGNNGHGSVAAQVNYFLSYLDAQTPWWRTHPGFFLQVDLEHWGYDDVAPQYGVEACQLLRAQTGKWVVLYAPQWAYGDTIGGNDPLWSSSYGINSPGHFRAAYPGDGWTPLWRPYSGRTPVFGQYSSKATIGSQPGCDANAFRGTLDELRALILGGDDMSAQAENILWAAAVGMPTFKADDGREYPNVLWQWEVARAKWQAAVDAREAADEVRDKALAVAFDGLVTVIKAGGGNVDAAPILAAIGTLHDDARAQFAALHAENAKLQAQVASYQAKEAAAAKAAADALAPAAG